MKASDSPTKRAADFLRFLQCGAGESDPAKAIYLLDKSLSIPTDLGMRLLTERALSRREILKAWQQGR